MKKLISLVLFSCCFSHADTALEHKALHLLNRMSFGPTKADMEFILSEGAKGPELWFNQQLHPEKISEPELKSKLSLLKSINMSNEEIQAKYPKMKKPGKEGKAPNQNALNMNDEEMNGIEGSVKDIVREMIQQKIIRAVESKKQFQEVLVDFWFNHFNVAYKKGRVKWYLTSYEREAIRPFVFGKFKDMLMATAKSPAMMFYLDNFKSSQEMQLQKTGEKVGLNENYARELMELHTLGVDGGYTQKDVIEAARVLTGWSIEKPQKVGAFAFHAKRHDPGPKKVLGFTVTTNQGIHEGEMLIEYLAKHPSTAHNIAKQLALKFISDNPSPQVINQIADTFAKTDGDLSEVYKKIFSMKEFWSEEKSKIRTPFEYLAFIGRSLELKLKPTPDRDLKKFFQFFEQTGQSLYNCQPPTGFKMTSPNWVSAGALVSRINLSLFIAQNSSPVFDYPEQNWEKNLENKKFKNPLEVLRVINSEHFFSQVKDETLQKISGQFNEFEVLTENHLHDEHSIHYFPVKKMIGLLMSAPELQRR